MKILVTGATGFIGKHLVKKLLQEKHEVFVIVRNSTKKEVLPPNAHVYVFRNSIEKLTAFIKKEEIDGVVHLASLFLSQHNPSSIESLLSSNILFSTQLLEASVSAKVPWFINTGTFWQHYRNKKYSPVNLYAATKQAFEIIAQYYIETSSIKFVTIKLSDTFGPLDTRIKIFNLWAKTLRTDEALEMSPGKQLVNISYIDNVIDGYVAMINQIQKKSGKKLSGKSFVISSQKNIPLKKLARIFEKINNSKLKIHWGAKEYRSREVMVPWNRGKNIPGWKPKITLEEGIRRTLKEVNKT